MEYFRKWSISLYKSIITFYIARLTSTCLINNNNTSFSLIALYINSQYLRPSMYPWCYIYILLL